MTPDAFHRVVQDYARYPEFVPEVKAVRVGRGLGDSVEVTYWLDVKLKLFDFTLRHVTRSLERIEWTLVRGGEFMRANEGAWTLESTDRGGTRATYAIEIDLGTLVPGPLEKAQSGAYPTCSRISRPERSLSVKQRVEARVTHSGYVDRGRVDCYKSRRRPDRPSGGKGTGGGKRGR